jgi:hypothetical protein
MNFSIQSGILGQENLTHASLTEFFQNFIMGYGLTDHIFIGITWSRIY